ncbi:MAG: hypothetical protein ACI4GV_09840 [Acutalibacteraceae bacterium]
MMKKIFSVLLTGLMAISIAACSNNNTGTVSQESKLAEIIKTDNTKEDYLTDTKMYKNFYSKVNDDEFNIKMNGDMDINGSTMSMELEVQKQGDSTYSSMKMMGMTMTSIQKDGYTYSLNSMTNTYTKTKSDENTDDDDVTNKLTNMTGSLKELNFVENALSKEDGTTDYEKYSMTGATMTFYFNGDEIKYIDMEQDTSSSTSTESSSVQQKLRMNVTVTSSIDASLFEIPEGYTEQSSDDTL